MTEYMKTSDFYYAGANIKLCLMTLFCSHTQRTWGKFEICVDEVVSLVCKLSEVNNLRTQSPKSVFCYLEGCSVGNIECEQRIYMN